MKHVQHVRLGELRPEGGEISIFEVFQGLRPITPWSAFDYLVLAPGEMRPEPAATGMPCEQGYVAMDGPMELTVGQQIASTRRERPGFIVESTGGAHKLKNLTKRSVPVLRVRVAMDVDAETQQRHVNQFWEQFLDVRSDAMQGVPLLKGTFDEQELKWRDAIHGGRGQIATRHVLAPRNFYSDWTFLDHAILDVQGSLGYHYHEALEESFVVLKGKGLMKIEDETFEVGPGSVTWQGIEQKHSLSNPGPEKLEFVRIAVRQAYTTIDV